MYLLVRSSGGTSGPTLRAAGQAWVLESFDEGAPLPSYASISYAWGAGRVEHPFVRGERISERTLAVLDAAARFTTANALWIDALCVPIEARAREATLRQLGSIYAEASEVLVVLSGSAQPLFDECQAGRVVSMGTLRVLEQEEWVSRFWTYQELAVAKELRFVLENGSSFALDGTEFLNKVGEPLARAKPTELAALPALDNLNDVLASWIHGGSQPFAYQIMAGLAWRGAERPADRFNAVLGAIDPSGSFATSTDLNEASEHFMTTCESKGDLSFIYSTNPRSTVRGRLWRPQAGEILPLLAWHTFGRGQSGRVLETHAVFDDLHVARQGSPSQDVREFIEHWLARAGAPQDGEPLPLATAKALTGMGCGPLGAALELDRGIFFPTRTRNPDPSHVVLIASEVRWVHGAPALLVEALPSGRYRCQDIGIFVGPTHPGTTVEIE